MEEKVFFDGQATGWLIRFTPNGADQYSSAVVPPGFPSTIRIANTFAYQIQVSKCLETPDGRMISGLMPIRGTSLFQADTIKNGIRSLLIVNIKPDSLQIVLFEAIPPFLWNNARNAGIEWFTGKKKTFTAGQKSFSTTRGSKRGFGNGYG